MATVAMAGTGPALREPSDEAGVPACAPAGFAVYVLPRHATSWSELEPLATRLKDKGYRVKVVLANAYASGLRDRCLEVGLHSVDVADAFGRRPPSLTDRFLSWWSKSIGWGANCLPIGFVRYVQGRLQLRHERFILESLLRNDAVAAVLLPGDRELSPVPAMIAACRRVGCRSVIAASNNPYIESLMLSRARDRQFSLNPSEFPPLLNYVAAWLYPAQVHASKDLGKMLFSPGWLTLALGAEDALSGNPWVQGGGKSDWAVVPSHSKKEAYVRLGVPAEKVRVVGSIEFDRLFESFLKRQATRRELERVHDLRRERPLAVMAVPNEAEHGFCDMPTHLVRQESFWRELAASGVNVVLCLHPKSTKQTYQSLADKLGFALSERPLVECLPAADLFVCSLSTTIFWAQSCGVPVLNMNYLGLESGLFQKPHGYYEAGDPKAFREVVGRALADLAAGPSDDLRRQTEEAARDYMFDGRSFERIVGILEEIIKERPAPSEPYAKTG